MRLVTEPTESESNTRVYVTDANKITKNRCVQGSIPAQFLLFTDFAC